MKLLVLIFLIGCGRQGTKQVIDPVFLEDISTFKKIYHVGVKSSVVFGKINAEYAAVCNTYSSGASKVIIDKTLWDGFSREQQQNLIFHELGHCELNLKHNDRFSGDCPVTLMYPSIFPDYLIDRCFIPARQYYLENL